MCSSSISILLTCSIGRASSSSGCVGWPVRRAKFSQVGEVDGLHNGASIPASCGYRLSRAQKIAAMRTAIGVDLGGSHVTAAVVTEDGTIHRQHEQDLDDLRFEAVIAALDATIGAALQGRRQSVVGIGIGSPGNIDAATGAVLYSPNFGWQNAPLGEALRKKFSVPVFVGNDARCATLGEYTFGTGKQHEGLRAADARHGHRRRHRRRRRAAPGQSLGRRRDRAPSDPPDRRVRLRLRKDRLLRGAGLGHGTDPARVCGRAVVSAQRAARRRARQAQLEEDPQGGAGRRPARAGGVEELHRRPRRSVWPTSSRSSIRR